ncbi:glycolipid transfer protein (GLTP) domain-containing protein [Ditylenchus destructor]|nr:glycolipid transfer protein (GLTP) domain-containing protein [Ditylenchus destructor]
MEPFNITSVLNHFEESLTPDQRDVNLTKYVNAFDELSRLFSMLGVVFSFVETDVTDKICILRTLHAANSVNYNTVLEMIDYECYEIPDTGEQRTRRSEPSARGTRTLLRLHRSLDFLAIFITSVQQSSPDYSSVPEIFRASYQKTLSDHHTWFVRKSVLLASYAMPSRKKLLSIIFDSDEENLDEAHVKEMCERFSETMKHVYDRVQSMYREAELLSLP